jgi:hypothetical protein
MTGVILNKKLIMKKILFLFFTAFCLISCEADDTVNLELSEGTFEPTSGIDVTGSAKIYLKNGERKVVLENFSVSEGPDLKVYLSTSATPDTFINLGDLTAATEYSIPNQVNLGTYSYVLIHCQQYNHLFAIAHQE